MTKWIKCNEQLPTKKETVIAYDGKNCFAAFYNDETKCWLGWTGWKYLNLNMFNPILWSDLPSPPEHDE